MKKDYRKGQRVIATIELDDRGQDIIELDVLANGVILGDSIIFRNGRLSLLGVGALDGDPYYSFKEFVEFKRVAKLKGLFVYMKETASKKEPVPWEASTLKYAITKVGNAKKPNRFIKK